MVGGTSPEKGSAYEVVATVNAVTVTGTANGDQYNIVGTGIPLPVDGSGVGTATARGQFDVTVGNLVVVNITSTGLYNGRTQGGPGSFSDFASISANPSISLTTTQIGEPDDGGPGGPGGQTGPTGPNSPYGP